MHWPNKHLQILVRMSDVLDLASQHEQPRETRRETRSESRRGPINPSPNKWSPYKSEGGARSRRPASSTSCPCSSQRTGLGPWTSLVAVKHVTAFTFKKKGSQARSPSVLVKAHGTDDLRTGTIGGKILGLHGQREGGVLLEVPKVLARPSGERVGGGHL